MKNKSSQGFVMIIIMTSIFSVEAAFYSIRGSICSQSEYGFTRSDASLSAFAGIHPDRLHQSLDCTLEFGMPLTSAAHFFWDGGGIVDSRQPVNRLLLNECYVRIGPLHHVEWWIGKRRLSWAVGTAFTPIDIAYPAKDAMNPSNQREGRFGTGIILPFDRFSVRALWLTQVYQGFDGVPDEIDVSFSKATIAGSVYLNMYQSDCTFLYAFIENRHNGGISFSRYVTDNLEIHGEGILRENRKVPAPLFAAGIDTAGTYGQFCVGMRRSLMGTKIMANLEYLYDGTGMTRSQFSSFLETTTVTMDLIQKKFPEKMPLVKENLNSFYNQSSTRRFLKNYIAASVFYNELLEYFNPSMVCMIGLDDGAAILLPSLEYRMYEAVLLKAAATFVWSQSNDQFSLMPFPVMGSASMTVYF
ncbi:MAG: hypothetical protein JW795_04880 [Chitinivibrionales bacterium]|nr:hypothetical protein [Chitinivibrionales bacterium]